MLLLKVAIFLPYTVLTPWEREKKSDTPLAPFAPLFLAVNPLGKTLAEEDGGERTLPERWKQKEAKWRKVSLFFSSTADADT